MSEENIENEEMKQLSSTENFIDAVTAKDFVSASKEFEELMLSKVDNALEQEKINIASQVYDPVDAEDDGLPSDVEPEQVEDDDEECAIFVYHLYENQHGDDSCTITATESPAGNSQSVDFDSGLEETIDWYLKNNDWWKEIPSDIFASTPWKN